MVDSNKKGARNERELVNKLDESGFFVMRAPASGSATTRDLPDVFTGNGHVSYVIEAKSSGGDPIYIDEEEIESLVYVAEAIGAIPLVGARFDYENWRFLSPDQMHRTPKNNYRVKKDLALDEGLPLDLLTDTQSPPRGGGGE